MFLGRKSNVIAWQKHSFLAHLRKILKTKEIQKALEKIESLIIFILFMLYFYAKTEHQRENKKLLQL